MTTTALSLPPIRALLADSHPLFLDSLCAFLAISGVEVAAVAAHGQRALELARAQPLSVAVVDLYLHGLGGVETTRRLTAEQPDLPVVLLATSRFDSELQEGIRSGASGFLFKGENPDLVLRTIVAAARGTPLLSPELARFLLQVLRTHGLAATPADGGLALTPDETRLLVAIEASPSGQPIGAPLGKQILSKLHRRHRDDGGGATR
jgi:DNA-binding NarL/FixJ family response regulator